MNVIRQLWMQLFRRLPVVVVVANLARVAAVYFAFRTWDGSPRMMPLTATLFGLATWIWHIGQGHLLRVLCMPESFLLPQFRRRLLEYGAVDGLMWVLVPTLVAAALHAPYLLLVACGSLLLASLGLTMGANRTAGLYIWPIFVLFGWMPRLFLEILEQALQSPLTPLLLIAASMLLLQLSIRPLLRIEDREPDTSPLESTSLGRTASRSIPGELRRTGAFTRRISALFDRASQRAMDRALAMYEKYPTFTRRMVLVRRLLLPHDNPEAIALRIAMVAVIVGFYFFAVMHRQHFNPVIIGGYAIMVSVSRFPQLNAGMVRMRPNMADLYLTLAPETRSEYQKTISDALIVLVPISILTALIYTALGAVLVHADDPWHMLFVAAIVSASASLAALAVHLVGPEGMTGRRLVNAVLIFGVMGVYWGGYWLVGWAGYVIGGSVLASITLGFSFGAWFAAQREYQLRSPCFDTPIG
ncbi:hypothetical protein [Dyella psychrodurans]|uniref:Uncharacterized protein n=1 Tax=Dyella psychrodurans TaxID=1927960 RepID=A0A370WWV9_9GAMM|nr:hypothetical protein [Dyella psychrodurans]RDS80614.1 hypothetical protein DWU99_18715 [Dyella psychrodurans]